MQNASPSRLVVLWTVDAAYIQCYVAPERSVYDQRTVSVSTGFSHLSGNTSGTLFISSSLFDCADRRLLYADGQRVYRPSTSTVSCRRAILMAMLLLLGGVEANPGPGTGVPAVGYTLRLGVLNAQSAVNKAALIHDLIDSQCLDLLIVTETWMSSDHSRAVTE